MNIENRKRLSQNIMLDIYVNGGVAACKTAMDKFPNYKRTFRKFINSLKGVMDGRDVPALEALFALKYGSAK
jgi:hypothetical protein